MLCFSSAPDAVHPKQSLHSLHKAGSALFALYHSFHSRDDLVLLLERASQLHSVGFSLVSAVPVYQRLSKLSFHIMGCFPTSFLHMASYRSGPKGPEYH